MVAGIVLLQPSKAALAEAHLRETEGQVSPLALCSGGGIVEVGGVRERWGQQVQVVSAYLAALNR